MSSNQESKKRSMPGCVDSIKKLTTAKWSGSIKRSFSFSELLEILFWNTSNAFCECETIRKWLSTSSEKQDFSTGQRKHGRLVAVLGLAAKHISAFGLSEKWSQNWVNRKFDIVTRRCSKTGEGTFLNETKNPSHTVVQWVEARSQFVSTLFISSIFFSKSIWTGKYATTLHPL